MGLATAPSSDQQVLAEIRQALEKTSVPFKRRVVERLALAALGSIPWVGGFVSAAAGLKIEQRGIQRDSLQTRWLAEHARKLEELTAALRDLAIRLDGLGATIEERIAEDSYLSLVRSAFRVWNRAETDEKRELVMTLLTRAASTRQVSDDVVRLFIDWLDQYHETHLAVIREVCKQSGAATRGRIWMTLYGEPVRDDSAEADLYRLLLRDLSAGGVIRQARPTTTEGRFVRRRNAGTANRTKHRAQEGDDTGLPTLESAFEDTKPYVLTELGRRFVDYALGAGDTGLAAVAPRNVGQA
jgi:hypothetical protein